MTRSNYQKVLAGFAAISIIAAGILIFTANSSDTGDEADVQLKAPKAMYRLEPAVTSGQHQIGLSGRSSLPASEGMLFTFDGQAERCFWMKDMSFNIDIIWAGTDKHITHIERDVSPATYPKSFCGDAQFVVEVNAGEAARNRLKLGDRLDF